MKGREFPAPTCVSEMRAFCRLCLNENLNQKCEIASLPPCSFLTRGKRETRLLSFNPEGFTSTNQLLQDKKIGKIRKNICARKCIASCLHALHPDSFFLRDKKDNHWGNYKNQVLQACHAIDWCPSTCETKYRCFVRETYPT